MQIQNENRGVQSIPSQFTSTLSQKGQVTIPAKVREFFEAEAGDQVQFVIKNGSVVVNVLKKDSLLSLFGSMPPKKGEPAMSWDDIRRTAREEMVPSE